ncbi:hypothetical protein L5515_009630 [Caenorhabditis briggsae]|uniref:Uncharacterized protein n=2 Tax=Caenorhabditis briggsae TaxID=6238 RepID=A0AAE9FDC5_CAEBR|nr:hypothetical protein L5515_009630 [Caenorhabditis briggsae]
MPPARGTKTLAWFMDNDILSNQEVGGASGPPVGVIGSGRRGSSSDVPESKSTTPPSIQQQQHLQQHLHHLQNLQNHQHQNQNSHVQNQQKKHKKFRKTASGRREGFQTSSQAMSDSSEDGVVASATVISGATSSGAAPTSSGNEEYWFYDVQSDGYYYEQNGAKGWRRRQPNAAVHKSQNGKDQEVAHMNVNGPSKYNQLLAAQTAAAQAAFLQQAYHMQAAAQMAAQSPPTPNSGPGAAQNPTMRYYDPNSDGFFYEMASVDGWKRRQPNKPVSASVSGMIRPYSQRPPTSSGASGATSSSSSSYGAALARGQFPRNTVKQPESTSPDILGNGGGGGGESSTPGLQDSGSTSSSTCGEPTTNFSEFLASVQRPSALKLMEKDSGAMENAPNSTAALFDAMLADLNAGSKTPVYSSHPLSSSNFSTIPTSPMKPKTSDSWNSFRSCSLFSPIKPSKRVVLGATSSGFSQPMGATPIMDLNDDTMNMLMRDLDKLWANTPVSGLNQA